LAAAFVHAEEVSRCYSVNGNSSCYYTNGLLLSWDDAKEFCDSKNATLPIITDDDVDNVFQQFKVGDSNNLMQDKFVWIGAHAQLVNSNSSWHWVNGSRSGKLIVILPRKSVKVHQYYSRYTHNFKRVSSLNVHVTTYS